MEVHTHSHLASGEKRKKFIHYLWEFLMLFLAVFCGFLAEYQLEHKIEKEKGLQYIASFYEDLKTDTAAFTSLINSYELKVEAFKNINQCFETIKRNNKSDNCLANLFFNSTNFNDLVFSDRTMQQLKNAGGLRSLKKDEADSILEYDNMLRVYMKSETTGLQETQTVLRGLIYSMADHTLYIDTAGTSNHPVLFSASSEKINEYFNYMEAYIFSCKRNVERMKEIKGKAINLIRYFKDRYRFK